jgi:hypothetical protein
MAFRVLDKRGFLKQESNAAPKNDLKNTLKTTIDNATA